MTFETRSKCIRLRRSILHSEYGKCPLITFWLVVSNRRCDQVRSNTHDTLWGNGLWNLWAMTLSSPYVLSCLQAQARWNLRIWQREVVTFETMNSGRSKIEPVRIYLNNLRRKACSKVQAGTWKRRPVFISQERVKVFIGASFTQPPGTPCIMEMKPFVITVCAHTHTQWPQNGAIRKSFQWNLESEHPLQMMAKHVTNYRKPKKPAW